ncbi:MAG: TRAP-type C4-dicarboxylate transport system, periplasmic component [Pelotomaculum thermopropionicum]|uniref:TRAP-type C4-dicarboxylate transport system, periplasmic component n=1 Tax=Pelotomaculum thermopropionicum TaxID=110500 RepID=A0A101HVN6_9FIRM|nr:MAG: TRAP-type C4-dicarboxylate transport system, periplasmic component [Pelotomaculum thermopropionicum]
MKMRNITCLAGMIFFIFCSGCSKRVVDLEQVNPEEKIVIKFSHVVAENTPKGMAAQRFAKLVKERTGGRVEVQIFPNSTLYKDGEEIEALQSGAVQIIAPAASKLSALDPQWQLLDLPYAFDNEGSVHKVMESQIGNRLFNGLKQHNIQALAFWDSGFKQMTNNVKPLVNKEDFKGLSFRVMINSQVLKKQFEYLGSRPVEGLFSNLYYDLETCRVNGEENTLSNIYSKKLFKVQPYLTISNHGYMGYVVMTNVEFWSELPEKVRRVLEDTLLEVTKWEREQALKMNREGLEQVVSSGLVQVHYQTEAEKKEWISVLEPIYYEFIKTYGEEMVSFIEQLNYK